MCALGSDSLQEVSLQRADGFEKDVGRWDRKCDTDATDEEIMSGDAESGVAPRGPFLALERDHYMI